MNERVQPHNIHSVEPDFEGGEQLTAAVVIPVYNRSTLLVRTLESLAAQSSGETLQVHVCDDGSEEDIKKAVSGVTGLDLHYHTQTKSGFGAGRARNMGARAADTDLIILLDADCLVPEDFVERHKAWHAAQPDAVLIGGRDNAVQGSPDDFEDYRSQLQRRTSGLTQGSEVFRALVSSNVSVPRSLYNEVGGFNEDFRHWGSEDTELGWRFWQQGAVFLLDTELKVDHQLEEDSSGGASGRQRARELNSGLLASLIPHRFYRKQAPTAIPESPKVSIILHDVPDDGVEKAWRSLLNQDRSDFNLIAVTKPVDHDPFAGATVGEPRIAFVGSLDEATDVATGEYLCYLNGHGTPAPNLLSEMTTRLDKRPSFVTGTVGYALPKDAGGAVRSEKGATDVWKAWDSEMPMCWFIRKHEAAKLRRADHSVGEFWSLSQAWDLNLHFPSAAIRLPGAIRTAPPSDFTHQPPDKKRAIKEVIKHPSKVTTTASRYLSAKREGTTFVPVSQDIKEAMRRPPSDRPSARYVGWTGQYNLGDDVMLDSVRSLLDWCDVTEAGDPSDLLILGGGTLINRNTYLKWLSDRDSPRVERMVLGTGVASPEFWGITEDTDKWLRWLSSCSYVGVRGPHSETTLRSWGFEGDLTVSGDSALLATASEGYEKVQGRIVIAPAWTKGELWGGSDRDVVEALATEASQWISDGRDVVCLASSPEDDGQIIQIMEAVGSHDISYMAGYSDGQQAIDLLASADVVIGERLHACVLAAAVETPFVAIEYRPKLRDFAASVDVEHLAIRTDELSSGRIRELADTAMAEGTEASFAKVNLYRQRLHTASDIARRAVG